VPISTIGNGMNPGIINNGMSRGSGNNGMTAGPVSNGMTPVASSSSGATTATDIQGWQDWVQSELSSSNGGSFESLLAARLPATDQSAFMSEYQALRTKHVADYVDGLKQGATWVPGESYHMLGCEKADQGYSAGLDQLLSKYFPTLSTDPNNTERGIIHKSLFDSANPRSYSQTSGGSWQPEVQSTSSNDAVRSHGGESSFG
jgi:hypothetical protein